MPVLSAPPTVRRAGLLVAAGAAVAALVTGCGSSGGGYSAPKTPSPPASSAPAAPGAAATLQTATDPTLGTIVTDGAGHTLYRFDHDTTSPSASNCTGACATLWPPVPATANPQVKGVDPSLLGSVTRPDGSKQLTLAGSPLYRYSPDTKPGDTKGQGFGGIWWAVTPSGGKAAASSAGSPSTSGY
jgi:predicted lipoprotein with Yx(FWY)xxD motif